MHYMFKGPDGFMHTGPTTSPENSYQVKENGIERDLFPQVAISPAFDMSILRQSCNAYLISVQWLLQNSSFSSNSDVNIVLNNDLILGKIFYIIYLFIYISFSLLLYC